MSVTINEVSIQSDRGTIEGLANTHGRILGCTQEELASAIQIVQTVLAHPMLDRARAAAERNQCRREVPVTLTDSSGVLIEGVVDLVFADGDRHVLVDFKTDEQIRHGAVRYERQIGVYAAAVQKCTGKPVSAVLMRI